jgi:hypothetical protein
MLDPEKDNNSKKFWKYIKSRKQDTMGIGTLKNNGVLAETAEQKAEMLKAFLCDGFLLFLLLLYKRCFFLISLLISVVIQGMSWCFPIFFFGICFSYHQYQQI